MRPISVQLYTLRDAMSDDAPGTLRSLAAMGYKHVEPHRFAADPDGVAQSLRDAGVTAPSAHTRFLVDEQAEIFAAAAKLGVETLVQPSSDKEIWASVDGIHAYAAQLNDAARRAAEHGLRLGYHNHAFEYEGGIDAPLQRLAEALVDDVVLEVDTYWAAVGGDDPAALLRALGDRVGLLHVKDGPITAETLDQVPVGAGQMPIAEILEAAPQALAVVELDAYRGDTLEAVAQSLRYLEGLLA